MGERHIGCPYCCWSPFSYSACRSSCCRITCEITGNSKSVTPYFSFPCRGRFIKLYVADVCAGNANSARDLTYQSSPVLVYACTYWTSESSSTRGQLCITRNHVCFHGSTSPADSGSINATDVAILIPLKNITSLQLVNANRVLLPDSIEIGTKRKNVEYHIIYGVLICLNMRIGTSHSHLQFSTRFL